MIRRAGASDIPFLIDMGARFHRESPYSKIGRFVRRTFEASLIKMLLLDEAILLVMAADFGPVGMIGGLVTPHFVSGDLAASELFWWVEPEYRGRGLKLLDAFEAESKKLGATMVHMIAPSVGIARLANVYERKGYEVAETMFVKGL